MTAALVAMLATVSCGNQRVRFVTLYTSVDQIYAEPLLAEFERETATRVRAVFDVEANKTVGLANRLVAERGRPQADVFWNNEFLQTLRLKREGVLAASRPRVEGLDERWRDRDGVWYGCGARVRVLLAAKGEREVPASLRELSRLPAERVQSFGMALPLFGTTATHLAALWLGWGPEEVNAWLDRLERGGAQIAGGNSTVRDLVARGSLRLGLTDSDDACNLPPGSEATIHALPEAEALFIPGTVAMVAGAPSPELGLTLINWLLSRRTDLRLIEVGASQISLYDPRRRAACLDGAPIGLPQAVLDDVERVSEPARVALQARFRR